MRFYKLDDVPVGKDDQVFKVSPLVNGIVTFITFGIVIAALVLAFQGGKPLGNPAWAYYILAALVALFGLFPLGMLRASLRPTNWVMRCNLSGLVIKYRAYENWRFATDKPQAVGLEFGEIAWAKIVKERRTTPGFDERKGKQTSHLTYLEMGLAKPDTTELESYLQADRNLRPDGAMITLDYPVQVLPGGVVQVRWSGGVSPSIHKAIEILSPRVKILDTESRVTDLTHHRTTQPTDERAKILELAKSGDEMGAAKLAQQAYGYSLSDATNFVDELLGKTDD